MSSESVIPRLVDVWSSAFSQANGQLLKSHHSLSRLHAPKAAIVVSRLFAFTDVSVSYCPQGLWASGALGGRCSSEPSKRCSPSAGSKTASMAGHWICCGHPLASATTGPRSSWPPHTCRAWRPIGSWYALLCRRHRLLEVLIAALAGCGTTRQSQRG